jgi:FlaA1/EpsC-like NDP-sugar epimerase
VVKQKHQVFVSLLGLSDLTVAAGACYGAWALRYAKMQQEFPEFGRQWIREPLAVPMAVLTIASLWLFGVYKPRRDKSLWVEQRQVIKASLAAVIALVVMIWTIGGQLMTSATGKPILLNLGFGGASIEINSGRWQLSALSVLLTTMLCLHRLIFRLGLREIRRRGWNLRHVAVIGTGRLGRITARTLDRNSWTGIHVSYFLSHRDQTRRKELRARRAE